MTIKLSEIRTMAEQDMKIDGSSLDTESLRTPQIHNKYLSIMLDEKLILKKLESDLNVIKRNKWLYYSGKMSDEQLKDLGWEPFDLAILRQDLDRFIDSDTQVIEITNKLELQKEKVNYLENLVKVISNRNWNIRSAIDWIKFTQGQ
jgi:hypothetical protein